MFTKEYDLCVCGGGVAGCAAALAAARRGLKTVLIENTVVTGGLATAGLVLIYLPLCDGKGKQVLFGITREFFDLCTKYGPADPPGNWQRDQKRLQVYFSPASFVLALDEVLSEADIDLWFDTRITGTICDGEQVTAVEVANKSGNGVIKAKLFVDATGDADVVHFGNGETLTAANSLVTWVIEHNEQNSNQWLSFGKDVHTLMAGMSFDPTCTPPGIDGKTVSEFLLRGRKRYLDILKKDYAEGKSDRFSRYPLALPSMVPMRHSRCIKGKTVLTDPMLWQSFPDSIGLATEWRRPDEIWEIPYSSLLPEKLTGILAAGRCTSAMGEAWEVTRVIPNAAMTGEAAGVAAYLSLQQGVLPHQLPVEILQETLRKECGFPIHFADIGLIPPGKRPLKEC
ncbi:MAG: FAD-dependent oxidoreductase [Lentisphaeria bacterium]|nr:FAD-dependent oxidoreductase [Lentisphaeria bacterium]